MTWHTFKNQHTTPHWIRFAEEHSTTPRFDSGGRLKLPRTYDDDDYRVGKNPLQSFVFITLTAPLRFILSDPEKDHSPLHPPDFYGHAIVSAEMVATMTGGPPYDLQSILDWKDARDAIAELAKLKRALSIRELWILSKKTLEAVRRIRSDFDNYLKPGDNENPEDLRVLSLWTSEDLIEWYAALDTLEKRLKRAVGLFAIPRKIYRKLYNFVSYLRDPFRPYPKL